MNQEATIFHKGDRIKLNKQAIENGASEFETFGWVVCSPRYENIYILLDGSSRCSYFHRSFVDLVGKVIEKNPEFTR